MLTARLEQLALKPGDWALDLGCGEGRHTHGIHMLGGVNVIGADLHFPSVQKAKQGLGVLPPRGDDTAGTVFAVGDATRLPFEDDRFEAVICSEVLEHLPDYHAALREMRRVLKPDGRLCITVPHGWPERICWRLAPPPDGYPFQPGGHIRIFDEVDLRYSVEQHGFRLAGRHHAHGLHTPYWWLKCWFWDRDEEPKLVKSYHRFLVWDLLKKPRLTRFLDAATSPVMGKSLVMYFQDARA
ncbi:MAG: class I SAM-dependent methyltransferase [Pseudomonadota bacterium]